MNEYSADMCRAWVVWDYMDSPMSLADLFDGDGTRECAPDCLAIWPEDWIDDEPPDWLGVDGWREDTRLADGRKVSLWWRV